MQAAEVKQLIESRLENAQVETSGDGCDFTVTVIGEQFAGMSPVKRQQLVYSCLTDKIADGSIHALTIKTYTPEQWKSLGA